jgi:threonine/homoserine/homoserine lactone efflux protein
MSSSWILTLANAYAVFALAVISPGPDFAVTVRTSISRGRQAGLACAAGVATANAGHIFLMGFGLGPLLVGEQLVYRVMLFAAGVFLTYLGVSSLWAARKASTPATNGDLMALRSENPFLEGFLINALNGKAIAFWISFFTLVLSADFPVWIRWGFPAVLVASLFAWFAFVATAMSHEWVRSRFLRYKRAVNLMMGLVLLTLAGQILIESGG